MNSFGKVFKVNIFGESHGHSVGICIDGCPPGIEIEPEDFETDLSRRRSGAKGTTTRREPDIPEILSGIYENRTTGSPITIIFKNKDTRSKDYNFRDIPRPGHADFVALRKYNNFNDDRGGGHFSGRITVGLVAAGVIAKKIISECNITAKLEKAGDRTDIENAVQEAFKSSDSIGGLLSCKVFGIPVGWGEPFFESVESLISHAVFSIPGIKGIEFGAGFEAAKMKGSEHNDLFISENGKTKTNHAGGILGGITNGNDIVFRVAAKPTSAISQEQKTYNFKTKKIDILKITGRHDTCIALRMPVVIEAVTAIVLADLKIRS